MLFAKNCVSLKVRSLFDEKKRLPVYTVRSAAQEP